MADYRSTTHTDFFFLPFTGGDRKSKRITATKGGERANIVGESKHPWHGFSSSHRRSINATQFFSIPPYFFPPPPIDRDRASLPRSASSRIMQKSAKRKFLKLWLFRDKEGNRIELQVFLQEGREGTVYRLSKTTTTRQLKRNALRVNGSWKSLDRLSLSLSRPAIRLHVAGFLFRIFIIATRIN